MPYKKVERVCSHCGAAYMTDQPKKSRYCSRKCAAVSTGPARGAQLRRSDPKCSVSGCDRDARGRQLCLMHLKRILRHGTLVPQRKRRPHGMPIEEWFWLHVEKTDSCWLWTGNTLRRGGYGTLWHPGLKKKIRAHHFLVGKPSPGMEWDHLCNDVRCVRPEHLELVTPAENRKREARRIKAASPRPEPVGSE